MNLSEQFEEQDVEVNRFEYEDSTQLVADFGPSEGAADVIGETVIAVVDGQQYEVEIEGEAKAFISNGVLTIEVDK